MRARVEITGTATDAVVCLDGVPIPPGTISGIELRATPTGPPRLELRFAVTRGTKVDLTDANVAVSEATATVLRSLGWTPPPAAPVDGR